MRRIGSVVLLLAVAILCWSSSAGAQKRVALVIGNGAYTKVPRLDNPKSDAAAIEAMSKAAGFDAVVRVNDLGVAAMRRALRDFSDAAGDADIAVVFYAGHGIEVGGVNYLIPIDAVLERDIDAQDEAISLDRINQILEPAKHLRLENRQEPFKYGSLSGVELPLVAVSTSATTTTTKVETGGSRQLSEAAEAWDRVKEATSIAILESYAARYKDTIYAKLARARIEELKKAGAERQRVALLQKQEEDRKRSEAEAAQKRDDQTGGTQRSGTVFRDCPECPEMAVVPAGEFMMGSPEWEEGRIAGEGPQHKVTIAKPFAVGKFEVTFSEWDACVAAGGCKHRPGDEGWGRGKRPVVTVSWDDATQYVAWLSKTTGKSYRLLTEAEWEYAARGVTKASAPHTPFATGATISTDQANYHGEFTYGTGKKGVFRGKTVEVGSFPGNAFGLHDLHGNVWEWAQDCYTDSYVGAPADGSAATSTDCARRVLRGGSWDYFPQGLRSANRFRGHPGLRNNHFGFRVARTL